MPTLFISYKRVDKVAVNKIKDRLKKDFYFEVWIDAESISGGEDWRQEIRKGIDKCDCMLLMLTPDACASVQVKEEVDYAKNIGRRIIPLQIRKVKEPDDLMKLGIEHLNYIDFLGDERAGWEKLLTDLPPVLERDLWRLQPENWERHQRYLRRMIINKLNRVSLTDITEELPGEKRSVELLNIYVPLPVDMSVTIKVSETDRYSITDWWVKTEKSETAADKATPEELREKRLREWYALKVTEPELKLLIEDVQKQLRVRAKTLSEKGFRPEQNWYMEAHDAANVQPRMVLTGNPGSGKTTFLKHLAICLAGDQLGHDRANRETLRLWTLPAYTPVFVRLRELVSKQFPQTTTLATSAHFEDYLLSLLREEKQETYFDDLRRQLENGNAIILLDGLDEVPDAVTKERRDQIIGFMDALKNDYEKCRIVITSRPYAYNGDWKLDDFGQTALIPLHDNRIYELAKALYSQVMPDTAVDQEAQQFVETLMERVKDTELRNTPLLFTMFAALWLRNRDLSPKQRIPEQISQLYSRSVDLMLERWTKKDIETGRCVADLFGLTSQELRRALEIVAFEVQSEQGSQPRADFRLGVLLEAFHAAKGGAVPHYAEALDYLEQRAGLLTSEAPRHYRFTHLSFQEYLAGCYLAMEDQFPAEITRQIQKAAGRWRNVVPLLADEITARGGNLMPLVQALVEIPVDRTRLPDAPQWEMVDYARTLTEKFSLQLTRVEQQKLCEHLTAVVEAGALPPASRAAAGRQLAVLGDPRPGVGVKDGIPDIVWCEIPGGPFLFGSNREKDKRAGNNEPDQHEVILPTFSIAKYPITYAQYEAFVEDKGYEKRDYWTKAGWQWKGDKLHPEWGWNDPEWHLSNHPVVGVTWYEAVAFCNWLSAQVSPLQTVGEGAEVRFRLPTEAEFEKAARGDTNWIYPYSDEFDANKGNTRETGIGRTSAVGMFPDGASRHGVLDMSGNVWEWSLSPWANSYEPHTAAQVEVEGAAVRVLRGGSWGSIRGAARVSFRNGDDPGSRDFGIGFRVVSAPLYR